MLEELPPITTFLNRVLALPIALQNRLFELFEELLAVRVEAAIASGTYDIGLETLIAESLVVTDRRVLHTHERTGAVTSLLTIRREDKNEPTSLEAVLALAKSSGSPFLVNTSSGRAALQVPASSLTHRERQRRGARAPDPSAVARCGCEDAPCRQPLADCDRSGVYRALAQGTR